MRALLSLLLLAVAATGCRRAGTSGSTSVAAPDTLIPGTFITSPGSWSHTRANVTRRLTINLTGTSVSWNHSIEERSPSGVSSSSGNGGGMSLSSPGDPWFAHVESPTRLWFFDGKGTLTNDYYDESTPSGRVIFKGKLQSGAVTVPPDLILRLPAELQKLLPPAEPPGKRPSL
ncbi:MAG: hypothetical protein B9S38_12945 [Verrucomicrobiia bacterium Tous-C4TDCM]|nr:MAG: hypothetical protein B9S38_12945 [Verrucomicrobiae bacterium Tous-C4TDCM]